MHRVCRRHYVVIRMTVVAVRQPCTGGRQPESNRCKSPMHRLTGHKPVHHNIASEEESNPYMSPCPWS